MIAVTNPSKTNTNTIGWQLNQMLKVHNLCNYFYLDLNKESFHMIPLSIAENLSYFASYEVTRIEANLISSQESKFLLFIQLQEIISSGLAVIITNTTSNATAYPVALRCQMSMCDIVTVVALRTW